MAPHSSTLACKIPWTEDPARLQTMGLLRVGHDWVISLSLFTFMHWRRKWQPTPVFLPGESQGHWSLVGCSPWGRWELDTTQCLHFHFSLSCIGEGNGNPLQCSCLENPRGIGAWWAAVHGSHRVGHDWNDLAAAAAAETYFSGLLSTSPDGQHWKQLTILFAAKGGEDLYSQQKARPGADCGSDHELLIAKFRFKLKKVGKTTRPFRYFYL